MPSSSWLARLLARARRPQADPGHRRQKRSRWNPAPFRLEPLEERLAPAFDLTLVATGTAGVTRTVVAGTATYEATATGAKLGWIDIATDLGSGLNVVVTSGTGGAEAGNITDTLAGVGIASAAGTSLTFQSGSG